MGGHWISEILLELALRTMNDCVYLCVYSLDRPHHIQFGFHPNSVHSTIGVSLPYHSAWRIRLGRHGSRVHFQSFQSFSLRQTSSASSVYFLSPCHWGPCAMCYHLMLFQIFIVLVFRHSRENACKSIHIFLCSSLCFKLLRLYTRTHCCFSNIYNVICSLSVCHSTSHKVCCHIFRSLSIWHM